LKNEPLQILLADDDETDRILFKEAFEELKIQTTVHTFDNGVQLMDYLNKNDNRLPHLLFLDLNMPRKSGLECLKEIRRDKKIKDISIAIYSTSNSEKDMEETFLNGANIYIHKPNDFNVLKQILEKALMTAYEYQDQSMKKENFLLRI
jgi:CheY-like chemotaxis protein